jgi:endogenous inhibitor of DNA gyrase (YacG/DUF329 family)
MTKAYVAMSATVKCPHCNVHFDIADDQGDEVLAVLCSSSWEGRIKTECPHCESHVTVENLEW